MYLILSIQVGCADRVIIRHTLHFVCPMLSSSVVPVVLKLRVAQIFVGIALMLRKCLSTYQMPVFKPLLLGQVTTSVLPAIELIVPSLNR